ncbi:uncharacterized protein VTP21DRAFT_3692 [Calcarisporiella thermophila]|uniref:uncharacterized protein n=1 Tax=Calcarisporiella thermophila TaxID=911321 RepID=UPI0037429A18
MGCIAKLEEFQTQARSRLKSELARAKLQDVRSRVGFCPNAIAHGFRNAEDVMCAVILVGATPPPNRFSKSCQATYALFADLIDLLIIGTSLAGGFASWQRMAVAQGPRSIEF